MKESMMEAYNPDLCRFEQKYDVSQDGCWLWKAATTSKGYGQFRVGARIVRAHRWAYENAYGPIPETRMVDHMCHEPSCVNPQHLQLVSNKQNQENRSGAQANNAIGMRGVTWHTQRRKWQARVQDGGRAFSAGLFPTAEEAALAAAELRRKLFTNSLADL